MNFVPLLESNLVIQIHVYAAIAAFIIGAIVLWRQKGSPSHRMWGKIWVGLMVIVAFSSFFINEIRLLGPFSPIHILSLVTLLGLYFSIRAVRRKEIEAHRRSMQRIYIGALVIAGAFTFLPGRIMYRTFLEKSVEEGLQMSLGLAGVLCAAGVMAAVILFKNRRANIA